MALFGGITGAGAVAPKSDEFEPDLPVQTELFPEIEAVQPEAAEPGPGFQERSFTLVGKVLRLVMRTFTPGAWQSVIQQMAGQMPAKIVLEPVSDLQWENEALYQQLLEELHDQGFVDASTFCAASMETKLHLLMNDAYDLRAVLYEAPASGVVLDLVTLYGDGTGITYVNREDPGYAQSPLHPNIYMGHVPVFELLDSCLRERPKKATLPESVATAPRLTELEYEFGAKRLRGEPVNPVEIAEAYLDVIERLGPKEEKPAHPERHLHASLWESPTDAVLPAVDGEVAAEIKVDSVKAVVAGKPF